MMRRRRWAAPAIGARIALVIALALAAPLASAGPRERDDAASAYDRGAKAYDRADYATASVELARADDLAPNAVTLELALAAVLKTDDAALGMTLAERADARPTTKALDASSHAARRKFASKVGKVSVTCPPPEPCSALLDGSPLATGGVVFVAVGTHRVSLARASRTEEVSVTVEAGKTAQLAPTIPAAPSATPATTTTGTATTGTATTGTTTASGVKRPDRAPATTASEGGISPAWFWLGTGLTAVLGGVSVASGLDTMAKHDAFALDRTNAVAADAGRAADRRTVALLAATGVAAVATVVVGVFFVRWRSGDETRVGIGVGPAGGVLRATF